MVRYRYGNLMKNIELELQKNKNCASHLMSISYVSKHANMQS